MERRGFTHFQIVGMVATFTVLGGFRSLGISLVISMMRLVILMMVAVLSILVWWIAIESVIVLIAPLIRPITISVSVLAVMSISVPVPVTATSVLSLGIFLGLLFAIHESGILATAHISVMAAFKELLKFEHVGLNYSFSAYFMP
jgi:hypothetical protein